MIFKTVTVTDMDENVYLLASDKAAIIIDPGKMTQEIEDFIKANLSKEFVILLTHNHFDHILGAEKARSMCNGKIMISKEDAAGLMESEICLAERFCLPFSPFSADVLLEDGEEIVIEDIKVKVMLTPGHSKGSVCYFIGDRMFSGDTLFRLSVGRTDFAGGDRTEQINSLKKIASIEGEYEVYPGHGPATRLSFEKQFNPYIKEAL